MLRDARTTFETTIELIEVRRDRRGRARRDVGGLGTISGSRSTRSGGACSRFATGKIGRPALHVDRARSPRSRRAVGVGDVAGERGDRSGVCARRLDEAAT